jgi:hypothetical protein
MLQWLHDYVVDLDPSFMSYCHNHGHNHLCHAMDDHDFKRSCNQVCQIL